MIIVIVWIISYIRHHFILTHFDNQGVKMSNNFELAHGSYFVFICAFGGMTMVGTVGLPCTKL